MTLPYTTPVGGTRAPTDKPAPKVGRDPDVRVAAAGGRRPRRAARRSAPRSSAQRAGALDGAGPRRVLRGELVLRWPTGSKVASSCQLAVISSGEAHTPSARPAR